MNAQKSMPMKKSSAKRAVRPRSFAIARARAVSSLGRSSSDTDGSGRPTASGIQDLDQLACRILPREAEEDLLESFRPRFGAAPQLRHRAAGPDRSVRDDPHAIAH